MTHSFQLSSERTQTLFGALIISRSICILLEGSIVLVERVVSQVSILVMLVIRDIRVVLDCCQPNKTFLIDVNSQRVDTHQGYVNSQIKLVPVQE